MVQSRGSELGPLTNTLTRTLPHDARNKTQLIFSIIVTGEIKAEEPQALLCHLPLQAARSLPSLQPSTLLPQPFGHLEISLQETQTLNCGSGDCQSRTRAPAPAGRAPRPGPAEPRAAPRGQPEELPRCPRAVPRVPAGLPPPPPRYSRPQQEPPHPESGAQAAPQPLRLHGGRAAPAPSRSRHGPAAGGAAATWPPLSAMAGLRGALRAPHRTGRGCFFPDLPRFAFIFDLPSL